MGAQNRVCPVPTLSLLLLGFTNVRGPCLSVPPCPLATCLGGVLGCLAHPLPTPGPCRPLPSGRISLHPTFYLGFLERGEGVHTPEGIRGGLWTAEPSNEARPTECARWKLGL